MEDQKHSQSQNYAQRYIKLVCIGDGAVGKTCLLVQFSQNCYNEEYIPTIFDNSQTEIISNYNNSKYTLGLWDTSGQSDYNKILPVSYQGANVFLVCFSITSQQSLENIKAYWIPNLQANANLENAAIVLVGTKEDLRNDEKTKQELEQYGQHILTLQEIQQVAKEIGADGYITCSAKTNENIQEVFQLAVKCVIEKKEKQSKNKCSCM